MRWYHYLALFFSRQHIGLRVGAFTSNLTMPSLRALL